MSLCFGAVDVIKQELAPLPPPQTNDVATNVGVEGIDTNKPLFDDLVPTVREYNGIRRVIRIPPEVDAHAPDYKGNLSVVVVDDKGVPVDGARIDIFTITAKIRRPRLVGDSTPIAPYPDVVAKRAETYYTGADGRLECDVTDGSYMLCVIKDNLGGRSDAFSVKDDTKEFTIKCMSFTNITKNM